MIFIFAIYITKIKTNSQTKQLCDKNFTLIAVGAVDKVTNVPAASYRTAGLFEFNKLYMQRINLDLSAGFA